MHNALSRLQNVFGFFTTVASVLACVIALLSLLTLPSPQISSTNGLSLRNVQVVKGKPHYYSRKNEEYAHVKFDLDVDLNDLFTWNTKQVFLYITASYPSTTPTAENPTPPLHRSIIWDAVLPHPLAPAHHNHYAYGRPPKKTKRFEFSGGKKGKAAKAAADKKKRAEDVEEARPPPGILKLANQRPKYMLVDVTGRLAERANASLELNWNVQPWVGALTWGVARPAGVVDEERFGVGKGLLPSWLSGWRLVGGNGAATSSWSFAPVKARTEAAADAGEGGLGVEKGKEAHRLMVG